MANQADTTIAVKVDRALWRIEVLRSTDYGKIDVDVKAGIVSLRGHVTSVSNQQRAEAVARTIPGVLAVNSYLVPDDNLLHAVAGALGKIEHAHEVKFFTGVQNGVVGLHGEVGSANVRSLAEKHAANVRGVRAVINFVRAPGVDLEAEDLRFLQPIFGEQIYFRDGGLCGTVHRVVINPQNRRVVAMIIQRENFNYQPEVGSLVGGKPLLSESLVTIPMSAIRSLTRHSGFLKIDHTEAARYSDFDPSGFTAPQKDWNPPYPYCPDDILFPVESDIDINQSESEPAFLPALFPPINALIQSEYPI